MISMKGYQPKEFDRSKIKVPEYLKKNKEPEYEYKVAWANERNKKYIEYLLNNGWSIFNAQIPFIYFRKEKKDVKEIQD
jgi:hypothetical protein